MRREALPRTIALWLAAIVAACFFSLPLLWMLSTAFKNESEVIMSPLAIIPAEISLSAFQKALEIVPMAHYTGNTLFLALFAVAGHLVSCPLAAYGLARLKGPRAIILRIATLAAFVLPFPVVMIPQYLIFAKLGLVNTMLPLLIPCWLGNPFYILYLMKVFQAFPVELEEAAHLEGASPLHVLTRIVLPLSWPSLAAVAILTIQGTWNDFLAPLIYLQDQSLYTVTLGLQFYRSSHNIEYNLLMAATTFSVLPVVILFLFFQRYFVQSAIGTGDK